MDLERIKQFREQEKLKQEKLDEEAKRQARTKHIADSVKNSSKMTSVAMQSASKKTAETVKQEVRQSGDKVVQALQESQSGVTDALNNLVLATVISKDPQIIDTAKNLANLLNEISKASDAFKGSKLNLIPLANEKLATAVQTLANNVQREPERDYSAALEAIRKQLETISKKDVTPIVNVPETTLDISPVVEAVKQLSTDLGKQKTPSVSVDMQSVVKGLQAVQKTISSLSFPVPNYVLPYQDPTTGKATQVVLTSDGKIPVSGSLSGGGDGAIQDGANSAIEATVLDYTNSNPLAVRLTDTAGDYIAAGAGTQYTEDAPAAADPVGTAPILVRKDTPATITSLDGDNVAQRGTNFGAAYTQIVTSAGAYVDTFGGGTQYTEDVAAAGGDSGLSVLAVRRDTPSTMVDTDGDYTNLIVDSSNRLHVNVGNTVTVASHEVTNAGTFAVQLDGAALTALQLIDNLAVAVDGNYLNTNMNIAGTDVDANSGNKSAATQRVVLATDDVNSSAIKTAVETIDNAVSGAGFNITQFAGTNNATGSGNATGALRVELANNGTGLVGLNAGTNNIGDVDVLTLPVAFNSGAASATTQRVITATDAGAAGRLAANSGVDIGDVDVTSISAGTNLIADVGIQPRTTLGFDTFMASGSNGSSILVATAQAVKAAAGKVYGYYIYNPEAAVTFVHFYNTAQGSVTVGTTNPLFTLPIPAGSAANLMSDIGITFGTAITIAATTTAGGNTAPSTGASATIFYK